MSNFKMKSIKIPILILTLLILLVCQLPSFAQSKSTRQIEADLAKEIINNFIDDSEDESKIYFLSKNFPKNLSVEVFNRRRKSKIIILKEKQRDIQIFFFDPFVIKSRLAIVTLNTEWRSFNGLGFFSKKICYKCHLQKNSKWSCSVRDFSIFDS